MDTTTALLRFSVFHLVVRPDALGRIKEELVVASDSRAGTTTGRVLQVLCSTGLAAACASRLFIAGTRPVRRGLVEVIATHAVVPTRFVWPTAAPAVAPSTVLLRGRGRHALFQAA